MESTPQTPAPGTQAFLDRYLTPIAVLLGAAIIAFALMNGGSATDRAVTDEQPSVNVADIVDEGEPFIGDPDAPTTVAMYYDYQCPFCQQFELQVMPRLIEQYVATGKTKVLFKDFQFLGPDSLDAALYARAVWEANPQSFYPWFVAVMEAQDGESGGFGNLASIRELSRTVPGIDTAQIDRLITENRARYEAAIEADRTEGASFGINGTPSIIVDEQLLSGLTPDDFYRAISAAIEEQL